MQNIVSHELRQYVRALVAMGVGATRIVIEAYGDTCPLVSNTTPDSRRYNRRVEIVVVRPHAMGTMN